MGVCTCNEVRRRLLRGGEWGGVVAILASACLGGVECGVLSPLPEQFRFGIVGEKAGVSPTAATLLLLLLLLIKPLQPRGKVEGRGCVQPLPLPGEEDGGMLLCHRAPSTCLAVSTAAPAPEPVSDDGFMFVPPTLA